VSAPILGLVHPGQMGAAIAAQARRNHLTVLWCPAGRSAASIRRAETAGLTPCEDLGELCDRADVMLSICPPAAAQDVATEIAARGFAGIYLDANAINPNRFLRIREILTGAADVIDAAIIGPPPTDERTTTLYLAGTSPGAELIINVFAGTTVRTVHLAQEPPAASALKMAYAGYQKASRALAGVAHALARRYDVTEHLLDEAERNQQSPLADPGYLPSAAARAWRWAPELLDVAETLADNDLPPELATAAAQVLDRWREDKDQDALTVDQALDHLSNHVPRASKEPDSAP
jgi:3-hydroxyisobutyrate dehydrogenase-like beta-hydroxyacid dehydrogenase